MRALPDAFAAHLATGVTTLCRCWKLVSLRGPILGFTDHDQDIALSGVVFSAATGLEGSELDAELGFAIGGAELTGALTSDSLTDAAVSSGIWDDATIETWLVNWADPTMLLLLDIGRIGEIRRADYGFTAELRSLALGFDEDRGRIYAAGCNADLGDARCGVALGSAAYTANVAVASTDGRLTLTADLGSGFASGWFSAGSLTVTSGANADAVFEIRSHSYDGATHRIDLWRPAPLALAPGDGVCLRAGCDKSIATCRTKFANSVNFRGFPYIPTQDFVLAYARQGDPGQNGTALVPDASLS